jgi:hypothetical protein
MMKLSPTNQFTKSIKLGVLVLCLGGLSTLTFNCGGSKFHSDKSGLTDQSSMGGGVTPGSFDKPISPYAMLTGEQMFASMLNVTGQTVTTAQKNEYNLRTGALADVDSLAVVNAPLMMATSSLAGEVCNGLIAKEKGLAAASRSFFPQVDFTKSIAQNSPNAFAAAAQMMAQAFYGRDLSDEEQQILTAYYSEFVAALPANQANQTAQTSNLYLTLCAGMLSSFDAMIY